MPPETMCETWGSFMHNLHDDMSNSSSWRVAARLFLKAAGVQCTGHPRDERLVEEIARVYVDELGKRPYISRPRVNTRDIATIQSRVRIASASWQWSLDELSLGRDWYSTFDKSHFRATLKPSTFDAEMLGAVDRSIRRSPLGAPLRDGAGQKLLRSLPLMPRERRAANPVTSVARERLRRWLRSSDAGEWRRRREMLYGGTDRGDADPDAGSAASGPSSAPPPSSSSSSSSSSS